MAYWPGAPKGEIVILSFGTTAGLLLVAVSADVPLEDDELLLWGIFTRFDCARDVIPAGIETRGAWASCRGPLGIDATWKTGYPAAIENHPDVIARVDSWWGKE